MLLYTDGSKDSKGKTSSAWHCVVNTMADKRPATLFEGNCQIREQADVKDGEIHAIQEGQRRLNEEAHLVPRMIYEYVENQNALCALLSGP